VSKRVGVLLLVAVYVLAVVGSHVFAPRDDDTPNPEARSVEIPMPTADGLDERESMRLSYFERGNPEDPRAPIIVLHGSPGDASGFLYQPGPGEPSFLDRLAVDGRRVYAVDLPGFGHSQHWVQDYSSRAGGRAIVALLDELGIERVHLVCWSNSGAVGVWMCEDAPQRLASLTLMAAVGAQKVEDRARTGSSMASMRWGFRSSRCFPSWSRSSGCSVRVGFGILLCAVSSIRTSGLWRGSCERRGCRR